MNLYSGKCTAVNHCAVSGEFSLNVIPPISQGFLFSVFKVF